MVTEVTEIHGTTENACAIACRYDERVNNIMNLR